MTEFSLTTHFQMPHDLTESLSMVFDICSSSIGLLNKLSGECLEHENDRKLISLVPLLLGAGSSAESILKLLADGYTNEALMLSRPYMERILNFSYLLIAKETEYQSFIAFSKQKVFRHLNRFITHNGFQVRQMYLGKITLDTQTRAAIEQFTGPRGGEKTRWTKVKLHERGAYVSEYLGQETPASPLIAHLAFCENASEALHGTQFGVMFHMGCYDPNLALGWSEEAQLNKQHKLHSVLLCLFVSSHIRDAIKVVAKRIDIGFSQ